MDREKRSGARRPSRSDKPSAKPSGLIRQAHGGALQPGAGGGPQPGSGRPPSALREAFRGDLETAREKMLAILEREGPACEECGSSGRARDSDVIGIFDKFAKYGIGERQTVSRDELVTVLRRLWDVVVEFNLIEDPNERLEAIKEGWLCVTL